MPIALLDNGQLGLGEQAIGCPGSAGRQSHRFMRRRQ